MKKIILLLIMAGFLGATFAFLLNANNEFKKQNSPLNIWCDLNTKDCQMDNGVKFSFWSKPLIAMTPIILSIDGLKGDYKNLNARIYGLNMDMGTIKVNFDKKEKQYIGKLILNSCILSRMDYRLELFDGDKPINIYIDFYLKS